MHSPAATIDAPPLQRGDVIQLDLLSWGRLGEAMAAHDGRDVFVFGGIPGETVNAEVVAIRRKYVAAQVVNVIRSSPHRVDPPCAYFGQCTGCQWQHVSYDAQLDAKAAIVVDALERIGSFHLPRVLDTIPSPKPFGYRNHARFNIWRSTGSLGFTHRERRRFVRIDHCMLMNDRTNELLDQLQGRCAETSALSIRASDPTGDYLVQPTLKNPDVPIQTGQKRYRESVNGREFRVASPSFFQVNVEQAGKLAELAIDALQLSGSETVVDAYAGVGAFSALLAPHAARIIGIEESTAAIADAEENAANLPNVGFITGKVEDILPSLTVVPDAVILDPSRTGCQPTVLETLLELAAPRIAYVSCNPQTLARDLSVLARRYRIESVQPLDMFPQTHHVECLASLSLKPVSPEIVLASASPRRRSLLSDLGIEFRIAPSNIPEDPEPQETPEEMVRRLSREKALAVAQQESADSGYYVAADSTVVLNRESIAKPEDADDARRMLIRLRGTAHQVTTGITVYDAATRRCVTESHTADVLMRDFTDVEMEQSIATGAPMDKAGAYAIQDDEFRPASLQHGCYSNVMGLPACRVVEILADMGCQLPDYTGMTVPPGCTVPCPLSKLQPSTSPATSTAHGEPVEPQHPASSTAPASPTAHGEPVEPHPASSTVIPAKAGIRKLPEPDTAP